MDIFTTQLTKVMQVPIKPASLKVKGLLKEAGASKLKEDPDHLENHENYFVENKVHENKKEQKQDKKNTKLDEQQLVETTDDEAVEPTSKEEVKHLDLYV